jgi:hypothetical protein
MSLGLSIAINTYSYQEKYGIKQVKAWINNSKPQLVVVVFPDRKIIFSWIVFSLIKNVWDAMINHFHS